MNFSTWYSLLKNNWKNIHTISILAIKLVSTYEQKEAVGKALILFMIKYQRQWAFFTSLISVKKEIQNFDNFYWAKNKS